MVGHLLRQFSDRLRVLKECDRKIDCDFNVAELGGEIAPVSDCARHHEFRKRAKMRIGLVRQEARRRNDSPTRVAHTHERLGADQGERPDFDFRLIPQFEPVRVNRFRDVDRSAGWRFFGQQCSDPVAQVFVAEWRRQQREHREAALRANRYDCRHHGRRAWTKHQNMSGKLQRFQLHQYFIRRDPAGRQAEDQEVGPLFNQDRSDIDGFVAFASDEAEFVQGITKKISDVRLAIGDAGARYNFALAEGSNSVRVMWLLLAHRRCPFFFFYSGARLWSYSGAYPDTYRCLHSEMSA